jgi:hypothetical protein
MKDQVHAPAALTFVPIIQEAAWSIFGLYGFGEEKILCPYGDYNPKLSSSQPAANTDCPLPYVQKALNVTKEELQVCQYNDNNSLEVGSTANCRNAVQAKEMCIRK